MPIQCFVPIHIHRFISAPPQLAPAQVERWSQSITSQCLTRKSLPISWVDCGAFFQLRAFLESKAQLAGVTVIPINPRYTSRTCPHSEVGVWLTSSCPTIKRLLSDAQKSARPTTGVLWFGTRHITHAYPRPLPGACGNGYSLLQTRTSFLGQHLILQRDLALLRDFKVSKGCTNIWQKRRISEAECSK